MLPALSLRRERDDEGRRPVDEAARTGEGEGGDEEKKGEAAGGGEDEGGRMSGDVAYALRCEEDGCGISTGGEAFIVTRHRSGESICCVSA